MQDTIKKQFLESAEVKRVFVEQSADQIAKVAGVLIDVLRNDGKILFFGNGGSATDASHLAAELVNRFEKNRQAFSAIALTTDLSTITSIANDSGYDEIFARQVRALGRRGDAVIGISTSGQSPNVLKGMEAGRELGLTTIAFTGGDGGLLAKSADHALIVPSAVTARIQETHITLGHVLCGLIEEALAD